MDPITNVRGRHRSTRHCASVSRVCPMLAASSGMRPHEKEFFAAAEEAALKTLCVFK